MLECLETFISPLRAKESYSGLLLNIKFLVFFSIILNLRICGLLPRFIADCPDVSSVLLVLREVFSNALVVSLGMDSLCYMKQLCICDNGL